MPLADLATLTPGLVGRATAERLASLAAEVPAHQAIVEIGVFMARTTVFLAAGAQSGHGAHVYGIDPWDLPGDRYPYQWLIQKRHRRDFIKPQTRIDAQALIAAHGLDDAVTLMRSFSVGVASWWHHWDSPRVGLLFVDGDHREEMVRADWEAWRPHLADGAVVAWDDYHRDYPGVAAVVDSLVGDGVLVVEDVVERKTSALAVTRYDHP